MRGIVVLVMVAPLVGRAGPLVNGDFFGGLDGWAVEVEEGVGQAGSVVVAGGAAELREGRSVLVALSQTFDIDGIKTLRFTVTAEPGFDTGHEFHPDAFEVTLATPDGKPLIEGWRPGATAFFNLPESGVTGLAPGVSYSDGVVSLDLSTRGLSGEAAITFGLVGGDDDDGSAVRVDDVVVVPANEAPVALAGPDANVECGVAAALDGSASTDPNGDPLTFVWKDATGQIVAEEALAQVSGLAPGEHVFTLTVTDPGGEAAQDDLVVTVADTTAPSLSGALAAAEVVAGAACEGAIPDLTAGVTGSDGCGAVIVTQEPAAGGALTFGAPTPVMLRATDAAGNVTEETTVVSLVDETPPSGQVTAQSRAAGGDCTAATGDLALAVVASDNCGGGLTVTSDTGADALLPLGQTDATVTITDTSGNSAEVTVPITVVDETPPELTLAEALSRAAGAACAAPVGEVTTEAVATDNCGEVTLSQSVAATAALALQAPTEVVVTAEDASGNTTEATIAVSLLDETPPVISGLDEAVVVDADDLCQGTTPALSPVVTDNCTPAEALAPAQDPPAGGTMSLADSAVLTVTVTDAAGNPASAEVEVTVADVAPPEVLTPPGPVTVSAGPDCSGEIPALGDLLLAADNCTSTLSATWTDQPLVLGTAVEIAVTLTDAAGNAVTTTAEVTLVDDTPPAVDAIPAMEVTADPACQGEAPLLSPAATDNCTAPLDLTVTQTPAAGTSLTLNVPLDVTVTVADGSGNETPASTQVTLVEPPDGTCGDEPAPPDTGADAGDIPLPPDEGPGEPDAGPIDGPDAGSDPDVGAEVTPTMPAPAAEVATDDGGCGCRTAPREAPFPTGSALVLLLALGAWLATRRA